MNKERRGSERTGRNVVTQRMEQKDFEAHFQSSPQPCPDQDVPRNFFAACGTERRCQLLLTERGAIALAKLVCRQPDPGPWPAPYWEQSSKSPGRRMKRKDRVGVC